MLKVHSPLGNIFLNNGFEDLKNTEHESLRMSRLELEKRIIRKTTDRGTDVGLNLDQGIKLRHGDIIKNENPLIIVKQIPEKVISVKIKDKARYDVMIILGHIIGNRHRPISIQNDIVCFPIHEDSEKEVFRKLLDSIIKYIDIKIEEQVFLPHMAADVHEH